MSFFEVHLFAYISEASFEFEGYEVTGQRPGRKKDHGDKASVFIYQSESKIGVNQIFSGSIETHVQSSRHMDCSRT